MWTFEANAAVSQPQGDRVVCSQLVVSAPILVVQKTNASSDHQMETVELDRAS